MIKAYYPCPWRTVWSILPATVFLLLSAYVVFFMEQPWSRLICAILFAIFLMWCIWKNFADFTKAKRSFIEIHDDHLIIRDQRSEAKLIQKSDIKKITITGNHRSGKILWITPIEGVIHTSVPSYENICSLEEMHEVLLKWLKKDHAMT